VISPGTVIIYLLKELKAQEVPIMSYSVTYPEYCSFEVKADADDDDQAVVKILQGIKLHRNQAHPEMPRMSEGYLAGYIRSGMKRL
jgi:hypothetical protein